MLVPHDQFRRKQSPGQRIAIVRLSQYGGGAQGKEKGGK